MAKIHELPGAAESQVEQPAPCLSCAAKDEELARLRARLHDPDWMIRRALALLSNMKGPALVGVASAAVLLMLATWPLRGVLEGWLHSPSSPPHRSQLAQPPIYDAVPFSSPTPSPTAVPSASMPTQSAAPSPALVIASKSLPSPTPSPLPVHPCSVTHGQPPACRASQPI